MPLGQNLVNFATMKKSSKFYNIIFVIKTDTIITNSNSEGVFEATHLFNARDL
jgi:hypothetical protein